MPTSRELINGVIEIIADETEISSERILSRERTAEVVDARHMVVIALVRMGIYTAKISDALHITPRNIQYIVTNFENRTACNRPLRNEYEIIKKKLRNRLEITTL